MTVLSIKALTISLYGFDPRAFADLNNAGSVACDCHTDKKTAQVRNYIPKIRGFYALSCSKEKTRACFVPRAVFSHRIQNRKNKETVYAVEVQQLRREAHYLRMVSTAHLDAFQVNTGICRQWLNKLQLVPSARPFVAEWRPWQQWRPEAEPTMRAVVDVFGVPWHVAQQLGTIDTLLYNPVEPSTLEPSPMPSYPSHEALVEHILLRADALKLGPIRVNQLSKGVFQITSKQTDFLPDPWTASEADLDRVMQEVNDEEEQRKQEQQLQLQEQLQQQQEQLQQGLRRLRRPRQLRQLRLRRRLRRVLQQLQQQLRLQQGEWQTSTKKDLLNIARWKHALEQRKIYSARLQRPHYMNDLPFYSVTEPLSPRPSWWFGDTPVHPRSYTSYLEASDEIAARLRKAFWESTDLTWSEAAWREEEIIGAIKSMKMLMEMPVRLWSPVFHVDRSEYECHVDCSEYEDSFDRDERSRGVPPLSLEIKWQPVVPEELRSDMHDLESKFHFEPLESWQVPPARVITDYQISSDAVNEAWKGTLRAMHRTRVMAFWYDERVMFVKDGQVVDKDELWSLASVFDELPQWTQDFTSGPAWDLLPDGVIAEVRDGVIAMPVEQSLPHKHWPRKTYRQVPSKIKEEIKESLKLPRTWKMRMTLKMTEMIPEDYTEEKARRQLRLRQEAFRRDRDANYEVAGKI